MRWEEFNSSEINALDRDRTIVILPLGSLEQHGPHMPLGTDTMLAQAVALGGAKKDGNGVVLAPPWYGFSAHHMGFAGTISLRMETLIALAEDIVGSVVAHGFRRILIVNGHGGNGGAIDVLAATLGHKHYGQARIAALTYFELAGQAIADLRRSESGGMGHAGEFETAMLEHLRPQLVHIDRAEKCYPETGSPYLNTDLLAGSAVRTYLDFKDISPTGTLGDPYLASPELGAKYFAAVVDQLVLFLADFRMWPVHKKGS
jgi:creatinine amidohydrolase